MSATGGGVSHDEVLVAYLESGILDHEGEAHLATCESCQGVLAEIDGTRGSLAEGFAWEAPGSALEDAVVAAIQAEAAAPVAPAAAPVPVEPRATAAAGAASTGTVVPLDARRRGRGRVATWALGAVAAAACLVAVLAVATRPSGDQVAAPDPFTGAVVLDLKGTDLAPGVTGKVQMLPTPSGVRISLDAPGLPRRDGGDYYQAWLRSADGVLVPIGTFHDANEQVWLWAGVPIAEFPTFTVTEESADNDQASSGKRVLAGSLPGTAPATTAPSTAPPPTTGG